MPQVDKAKQAAVGARSEKEEYSALETGDFALESDHGDGVEVLETGDFTMDEPSALRSPGIPRPGKK